MLLFTPASLITNSRNVAKENADKSSCYWVSVTCITRINMEYGPSLSGNASYLITLKRLTSIYKFISYIRVMAEGRVT